MRPAAPGPSRRSSIAVLVAASLCLLRPGPAAAADYSVGVISGDGRCPAGSSKIVHYMDEEDNPNHDYETDVLFFGTWSRGWVGATYIMPMEPRYSIPNNGGVQFTWCKVDGTQFKPLSTSPDPSKNYAVLKLGTVCPPGSIEFWRNFDNEDDHNGNYLIGDISPNQVNINTTLSFCLFGAGSAVMSQPPNLGVPYGVLALPAYQGVAFPFALDSGLVHTDEEFYDNGNAFWAPPAFDTDARRIVQTENNPPSPMHQIAYVTILNMVKVSTGNDPQCGRCGGTVQAGGVCSASTPPNAGQVCSGCGGVGVVQCDGTCTVYSSPSYGQPCGCGGTVRCDGTCTRPPCDPTGGCASGQCCEPGTTRCRVCAPAGGYCP